jgi:hypothetical protein
VPPIVSPGTGLATVVLDPTSPYNTNQRNV